ncbi:DNA adenine methylase [Stenotrophomonas sp. PSU-St15]
MNEVCAPAFRYHGSKFRLAPWITQHLPAHRIYVEPFGGAAGVLLQKPRSYAEVYNDLDGEVVNFFRVLQKPVDRERLVEACVLTPYARAEFEQAWEPASDPVERARRLLIRAQMGFGSAGATKTSTGFRIDSHRAYGTAQQLWARFPSGIAAIADRFSEVLVENKSAIEVIRQHDSAETLHYLDPPYLHSTRVMHAGTTGYYRHEMTEDDHLQLLEMIQSLQGMVVISGYRSELYDERLQSWRRLETRSRIAAGRGCTLRTECIWLSPAASSSALQQGLPLEGVA